MIYGSLLVRPYAAALRASVVIPSPAMLRQDLAKLREILSQPATHADASAAAWAKYVSEVVAEYQRVCRYEARLRRRAAAAGDKWEKLLSTDLGSAYAVFPRQQLEWLSRWGHGKPEDRASLTAVHAFVVGHRTNVEARSPTIFERDLPLWVVLGIIAAGGVASLGGLLWTAIR